MPQETENTQDQGPPRDYAGEIRERLRLLVKDRTQAEISRVTGTPGSNVSRYLLGTKVPAEFCGELVQHLGVSPVWLMTGEGSPYLSDIAASTADTSSNLVEMVEAMNAVMRMRIGSLTGKDHLKTLRQLNETLELFEKMQERFNSQLRPFFHDLIEDYRRVIISRKLERAGAIRAASEHVYRLCPDRELRHVFDILQGSHEFLLGNFDRALAYRRDAFLRTMSVGRPPSEQSLDDALSLVMLLLETHRLDEAQRAAESSLILAEPVSHLQVYQHLRFLAGYIEVGLGNPREGIDRMTPAFFMLEGERKRLCAPMFMFARLMSGELTLKQAMAETEPWKSGAPDTPRRLEAMFLMTFACWDENPVNLKVLRERYLNTDWSVEIITPFIMARTKTLDAAIQKPSARLAAAFWRDPDVQATIKGYGVWRRMGAAAGACQISRLCDARALALKQLAQAEQIRHEVPEGVELSIWLLALHYRNAVELLASDKKATAQHRALLAHALGFFEKHSNRGFVCFKHYADMIATGGRNAAGKGGTP